MATIKEVAKYAGVGVTTVSRYIRKNGYVSAETSEKIKEAIEALNYRPNELARALKSKKTYTIALIIPTISNQFFTELTEIIQKEFIKSDYKLVLFNTEGNIEYERRCIHMVLENQYDGIIIGTGSNAIEEFDTNIPGIILDREIKSVNNYPVVKSKHYEGAALACRFLVEKGCKKILHLTSSKKNDTVRLREKAYFEVMNEYGIKPEVIDFDKCNDKDKSSILENKFDGIFSWNDYDALEILNLCSKHGINIPKDLQVIGYDDISLSKLIYPKLTTVHQPIDKIGKTTVQKLIGQIENGKKIENEVIEFDNYIIERDSTR